MTTLHIFIVTSTSDIASYDKIKKRVEETCDESDIILETEVDGITQSMNSCILTADAGLADMCEKNPAFSKMYTNKKTFYRLEHTKANVKFYLFQEDKITPSLLDLYFIFRNLTIVSVDAILMLIHCEFEIFTYEMIGNIEITKKLTGGKKDERD